MHAVILKYLKDLRASYWFIPSLMTLAAIIMSFVLTSVDSVLGERWLSQVPWLHANEPAGARAVLSTIAGSMITVAGVTFSMTIVAVSHAASQLGPRLIRNFMRDRSNQVTLGVFIGTFIYCLLVLRTIRDASTFADGAVQAIPAFVPHIAILFALFSVVVSVAMLIYYIHHIPESINASNLVAKIGAEMACMIDDLFPQRIGQSGSDDVADRQALPDDFYAHATPITADFDGYVQVLDDARLMQVASEHELIIRVEYRPGDFVTQGKVILFVWPAKKVNAEIENQCRKMFAHGIERTPNQNILFLLDQLVEIVARALSPGVNDPFTANSCIDWLQAMFSRLIERDCPSAFRLDENDQLRVVAYPVSFEKMLDLTVDQMRLYVSSDPIVALRLMKMFADLLVDLEADSERAKKLLDHAKKLNQAGKQNLTLEIDRDALSKRYESIKQLAQDQSLRERMSDDQHWLEGTA